MTKKLFIVCAALVWTVALVAQNIAVVSPEGETSLFKSFTEAVDSAQAGSVIYLPGGTFSVRMTGYNNFKITKKLTIIGIGHNTKRSDNPDGQTIIDGDLSFHTGSDGSALMGCYVNGSLYIGIENSLYYNGTLTEVNDILIRYNNISEGVFIIGSNSGTIINQNYMGRYCGEFNLSSGTASSKSVIVTNNIIKKGVGGIRDSFFSDNVILSYIASSDNPNNKGMIGCYRTSITNNIIFCGVENISECEFSGNMMAEDYDEDNINVGGEGFDWSSVFKKFDSNNPLNSDFHFKGNYTQYNGQVGIYAGDGFSDKQLAPVPYIVAKHVDEQTDAQGKLSIKVRVKAGDSE
ncbi:MAG: hypothetical protein IKQ07_11360 [Bacteroidaceae bacterium]|nr:hypothetical protein [Bacteroidaceae bacterium]